MANFCSASLDKDLLIPCLYIRLISTVKHLFQGHLLHNSWHSVLQDILDCPIFSFSASCVHVSCCSYTSKISQILLFSYLVPQPGNTILISHMECNRLHLYLTYDSCSNASQNEISLLCLSIMLLIHHKL